MSNRRTVTSFVATAMLYAIASTPAAHARTSPLEHYLRCVARERAQPLRDAGATTALLKLERYAICFRLHLPAREVRADPAPPCPAHAGSLLPPSRQQARLREVAAHATVAAREARGIAAALSGEEAAHALRVARDLAVQAEALQRHVDALDGDATGRPACAPSP